MDESGKSESGSNVRKSLQLRYAFNYNQELSRLMGVFSFYFTNGRFYRAFTNLDNATYHVTEDRMKRLFIIEKDGMEPDANLVEEFESNVAEFRSLFGSGPSLDGKLSFLDLKPRQKPDPLSDRVIIPRPLKFRDMWDRRPTAYTVFKIGFYYEVTKNITTPAGMVFPQVEKVPSFDWGDRAKMSVLTTNTVPYAIWEDQQRKVLNELFPILKRIELTIARYLHQEGIDYVPAGASTEFDGLDEEGDGDNQEQENEDYDG